MKYLLTVLILFSTCAIVFAQKQTKSEYTISFKNRQLSVRHQGRSHQLALDADQIDAAKITEAKILFADRKNGFTYLVIDVSGQSRDKENDRQCGAGVEANLIWIKLDSSWKISEAVSERYESCWSPITSDEGYKTNGRTLTILIDNLRDDVSIRLSYNANQPEKGFERKSSALNKR